MSRTKTVKDYRGHVIGRCSACGEESITYVCDRCYSKDYGGSDEDAGYRSNPLYTPDDGPEEKKIRLPWRSDRTAHRHNGIPILPRFEPNEPTETI